MIRSFEGKAERATAEQITALAVSLGIEPAVLRAVIAVEAAGAGYDAAKRPKALFERHHFHRHLRADPAALERAVAEGLAYPIWGTKPYPRSSGAVYDEIQKACAINEEAALLSTSWGLGQVMGSNFKMAGCPSVEVMVQEAMDGEINQLRHMGQFIAAAKLLSHLRTKDWAAFARGYNGPSFARHGYDTKLAKAYDILSKEDRK